MFTALDINTWNDIAIFLILLYMSINTLLYFIEIDYANKFIEMIVLGTLLYCVFYLSVKFPGIDSLKIYVLVQCVFLTRSLLGNEDIKKFNKTRIILFIYCILILIPSRIILMISTVLD